jgi:hypothetical protein
MAMGQALAAGMDPWQAAEEAGTRLVMLAVLPTLQVRGTVDFFAERPGWRGLNYPTSVKRVMNGARNRFLREQGWPG